MKFEEAMKLKHDGTNVKRRSKGYPVKLTRWGIPKYQSQDGAKNYIEFEFNDYLADDWVIVEEKKTLSDKIYRSNDIRNMNCSKLKTDMFIELTDIRQFIKDLKKEMHLTLYNDKIIDKLAGDQLK